MIETTLWTGPVTATRLTDGRLAGGATTRIGAVRMAAITGRADRKEAVTRPAGLLTEGLFHGIGAQGSGWTIAPNRGKTGGGWLGRRSPGRSRGPGVPVRALTLTSLAQPTSPTRQDARGRCPTRGRADAPTGRWNSAARCPTSAHRHHLLFLIGNTQAGLSDRDASRIPHFHALAHTEEPDADVRSGGTRREVHPQGQ